MVGQAAEQARAVQQIAGSWRDTLKPQKDDICADAGYVIRVVDTTGDVINSANFNRQNWEA